MNKKIKDIATITAGIYVKPVLQGEVYLIQAMDYDQDFVLRDDLHPTILHTKTIAKNTLEIGDILVRARGNHFLAILYSGEVAPAVASSTFLILRNIDTRLLLPQYVVWFINHPKNQYYLQSHALGSSIAAISKKVLGDMPIVIPPLQKQQIFVQVTSLLQQERIVQTEINNLRELIVNQQLLNLLNND